MNDILYARNIPISDKLNIYVPTLKEIKNFSFYKYYSLVTAICANPKDYAVPLYDMGLKYMDLSEYDLFNLLFTVYINDESQKQDLRMIFGNDSDLNLHTKEQGDSIVWCNSDGKIVLDSYTHSIIDYQLRYLTGLQKDLGKAGNLMQYKREIEKQRRLLKKEKAKNNFSILEREIVMAVNNEHFKYNYETVLDLSLYQFNNSVKQILKETELSYMKQGAYVGMFDVSKVNYKDLSLIPID